MNYTSFAHIKTIDDVKRFFHHLTSERKLSFHPDDDFSDYVFFSNGKPAFTTDEVKVYNRLMDESFDVCEKAHVEIYDLGFKEMAKVLI